MMRRITIEIVVFAFIVLFVYAATTKLMDFQQFHIQLSQSPMLTDYAPAVAWGVPFVELAISALLIFDRTRLIGLYAAFGLMVMFTTYIVLVSRFSDFVPCSCGGVIEKLTWTQHLYFNTAFIALGLVGIWFYPRTRSLVQHTPTSNASAPGAVDY